MPNFHHPELHCVQRGYIRKQRGLEPLRTFFLFINNRVTPCEVLSPAPGYVHPTACVCIYKQTHMLTLACGRRAGLSQLPWGF